MGTLGMPDADLQLLIAIESLGGGGAERVALDLARAWPPNGARPVLLVAARTGAFSDNLPPDLEVIEIGIPSSPRNLIPFLWRLRGKLSGRNLAGVLTHMTGMNRMMMRAALLGILRAPVVVVEHNNFLRNHNVGDMSRLRSFLLMRETGCLYRQALAVVGCSRGVAQQALGLFDLDPGRVHAIPNPVAPHFAALAPMARDIETWFLGLERPIFVSVGRMVPQKAFDALIRAFALQPRGSLVILGEGPLRADLSALVETLGVADRVRMPGFLSAPEEILQAADVYVSSSLWEGYPLVLIEAFAAGLPVVARACDFGPEEIVISGRPGQLVRSDRIEELASAMTEVATTTPRVAPGSIPLPENTAAHVAARYCALFRGGEQI
ncbi:glycosyltransferase [Flavimaricola sp.]|nr:glycosyltransferase [Flavimaricola sp.]MDA9020161.1 glycosyltransferase [Flavimaricola sp.]